MIRSVVTLGGPPGSGKTTAAKLVAAELGLDYHSAGELFRAEAARRGMELPAFGAYAQAHPEVDRELDGAMVRLARPGALLEGRIQGVLCRRRGTPAHAIVVTATFEERSRRVAARDEQTVEEARRAILEREASEADRYRRYYGIELADEPVDLLVDSTAQGPEAVARVIVTFLHAAGGPERR